jgi:hypothetical protein
MRHASLHHIEEEKWMLGDKIAYAQVFLTTAFYEPVDSGSLYIKLVEEAHEKGVPIRNCYLCKYHGQNRAKNTTEPIFCKFFKKTCGSNKAVTCQYYRTFPKNSS